MIQPLPWPLPLPVAVEPFPKNNPVISSKQANPKGGLKENDTHAISLFSLGVVKKKHQHHAERE
jgi:hypothetical protein